MDLNAVGATAATIVYERHGLPDSNTIRALCLTEEAGEVARAVLKAEQGIRGDVVYWREELRHELAGVVIAAAAVAQQWGIDLEEAVHKQLVELDELPEGAWHKPRKPNSAFTS